MGLSIAVFVPEGIVIASDGLSEIRNQEEDQGFLHKKHKRLFVFQDRFIINIHGNGYIKGLPYAVYVEDVFNKLKDTTFSNIKDFAVSFNEEMCSFMEDEQNMSFYLMGMDTNEGDNKKIPVLLLSDNGIVSVINRGIDSNIVYNYHSIGHSLWLNKLLLPTYLDIDKGERIDFGHVDIDFSKLSLDDAFDFSKNLMMISRKMDIIVQLKQMIGENITYGLLSIDGRIKVFKDYSGL